MWHGIPIALDPQNLSIRCTQRGRLQRKTTSGSGIWRGVWSGSRQRGSAQRGRQPHGGAGGLADAPPRPQRATSAGWGRGRQASGQGARPTNRGRCRGTQPSPTRTTGRSQGPSRGGRDGKPGRSPGVQSERHARPQRRRICTTPRRQQMRRGRHAENLPETHESSENGTAGPQVAVPEHSSEVGGGECGERGKRDGFAEPQSLKEASHKRSPNRGQKRGGRSAATLPFFCSGG